jgi:hypothetical protein
MEEAQRERDKMDELRRQAVSQATSISADLKAFLLHSHAAFHLAGTKAAGGTEGCRR